MPYMTQILPVSSILVASLHVMNWTEIILSSHTHIHVHSEDQGCTKGEEPILVVPYIELNKNIQVV